MTRRHHLLLPILAAALLRAAYQYLLPPSLRTGACSLVACFGKLAACVQIPTCKAVLDCISDCEDESGAGRLISRGKFAHVQHPEDKNLCVYGCFDLMADDEAEAFVECVGSSGCLESAPPDSSDICAEIPPERVVPFSQIPPDVFEGRWEKVLTNSWDTWPCQSSEFFAPKSTKRPPLPWMTQWPDSENVWRMDLNWTIPETGWTFSMSSELTPRLGWSHEGMPSADPTGRTHAVMWGTEAHENWYILDYDAELQSIAMHVCAYTPAVRSFDAITMVLVKEDTGLSRPEDFVEILQQRAMLLPGNERGTLVCIKECKMGQ